jgi:hypothetical protein
MDTLAFLVNMTLGKNSSLIDLSQVSTFSAKRNIPNEGKEKRKKIVM